MNNKKNDNELGSMITLVISILLLLGIVLFTLSNQEKAKRESECKKDNKKSEVFNPYTKKNRIKQIDQNLILSDLTDERSFSLDSVLKKTEVSGESKSIYFNQLLIRFSSRNSLLL